MVKVNEIAFIGYPVTDVDQAIGFYEGILGLSRTMDHCNEDGMRWVEYDIGANTLAISNAWRPSGMEGPSVALEVADFEQAIAELQARGVRFALDAFESPVCRMAVVHDPDGNAITIHKRKG